MSRPLSTAGVADLWFHDIRRTASTLVYEQTRNIYAAKDLLGQSSVDVTERYLDTFWNSNSQVICKFNEINRTEG